MPDHVGHDKTRNTWHFICIFTVYQSVLSRSSSTQMIEEVMELICKAMWLDPRMRLLNQCISRIFAQNINAKL